MIGGSLRSSNHLKAVSLSSGRAFNLVVDVRLFSSARQALTASSSSCSATRGSAAPSQTAAAAAAPSAVWGVARAERVHHLPRGGGTDDRALWGWGEIERKGIRRKSTWELRVRVHRRTRNFRRLLPSASGLFPRAWLSLDPQRPQSHQKVHAACLSEPPPAVLTAGRRRTSRPRVGRRPACAVRCATARQARG